MIRPQKAPSFRGVAEGCEPGTYFPEACVYGFRARRRAAPRNDGAFWGSCAKPPEGGGGRVREAVGLGSVGEAR